MRGLLLTSHGEGDRFQWSEELTAGKPAAGEALVRVMASSVNQVELVLRRGYPGLQLNLPHIMGGDVAGIVEAVGDGVEDVTPGERVVVYPILTCGKCTRCRDGKENLCLQWQFLGMHIPGGWRELVTVPARNLVKLPEAVSFEAAAAAPIAGMTAYHGIVSVANLSPGETFFIWGGAGGLGTWAVQIAKRLGATVFATAGSDERVARVKGLSADHVFNRKTDDISAAMKRLASEGVDVVLNYVGPAAFPASFDMLKRGGQMLLCGIISGRETMVSLHQTYLRHLSIKGLYLGTKVELKQMIEWISSGKISPVIHETLPMRRAPEALAMLESGQVFGKVILTLD